MQTKSLGHGLNCYFVVEFGARNVKLWLIRLELEVVVGGVGLRIGRWKMGDFRGTGSVLRPS